MRKIKFKNKPLKLREDLEVFFAPDELSAILIRYDYDKRREEQEAERQKQENWNTLITNLRRLCNATN